MANEMVEGTDALEWHQYIHEALFWANRVGNPHEPDWDLVDRYLQKSLDAFRRLRAQAGEAPSDD